MRASSPFEEKLIALIEPAAADLGFRIVRVRLSGLKRKTLQIMAERKADGLMGLEDCERLSRGLSPLLEANDPIQGEYALEISSPGIDRPLVEPADFARFIGHLAKIETRQMIDGRRRFRGDIVGVEGETIKLATPEGDVALPFAWIGDARLVLTDKLIEEDLRRARQAEDAAEAQVQPEKKRTNKDAKRKPS